MSLPRYEKLFVALLVILAFWFRWYLIRNNQFVFYYDQGRDAFISRSILEKADFKIQGPSASGTTERIYNGVFYYYLIGPIYTLFRGNPLATMIFLSFLGALAVIPVYWLGKEVFNSQKVGFVAAFLMALSSDAAQLSTWLSNPGIGVWLVPFFYLFLWRSIIAKRPKFLPLTALFMGLSAQATLYDFYLLPLTICLYLWQAKKQKKFFFLGGKTFFISLSVYLLSISSMIFTQLRLLISHAYTLSSLTLHSNFTLTWLQIITNTGQIYWEKFQTALPFIFGPILIYFFFKGKDSTKKIFFSFLLLMPMVMFFVLGRGTYYAMAGVEAATYLITAKVVLSFKKSFITALVLIIFLVFSFYSVGKMRQTQANSLTVQKGVFFNSLLAVVDQTYIQADGSDFSISTLTEPYKYNTTWAYLYSWYGQNRYGYLPKFVGPDQTGLVGADALVQQENPEPIHFSIYESAGPLKMFLPEFERWQEEIAGPVKEMKSLGAVAVEKR